MGLLVQKFGGSSLKSIERIQRAAKRIAQEVDEGHQLVIVVSAMGDTTDHLTDMAKTITPFPHPREMDQLLATGEQVSMALLCMALHQHGVKAVSLTGWQAGIITEDVHTEADIVEVQQEKILSHVEKGRVVVVAGFQGVTGDGEVTTIGRGGSDTTAVVLAAALGAERCDILTDVDGVYTADPRIVPHARPLPHICYDEMLALSRLGAHVLHPRAVACAMQNRVPLIVRSSFHEADGTRITETRATRSAIPVSGIACMEHLVNVTLALTKREPTVVNRLTAVAAHPSLVRDKGTRELSFLIKREHVPKLSAMLSEFKGSVERVDYEYDKALLSVVGAVADNPDIVSTVEEQLHRASIKGKSVTTSRHSVSCLICQEDVMKAANALHQAFDLDKAKEAVLQVSQFQ